MSGLTYRDAGVDLEAADESKRRIAELVRSTRTAGVLGTEGGFGGLFRLPAGIKEPVLVSSADGVGTKLKLAFLTGRHDTVGEDLVNHCVNDILVQGARPLFFLDYIGAGRVDPSVIAAVVEGVSRGCRKNGCALLGGETAEMPDFYGPGEYDLAGTIVGVAGAERILDGTAIRPGDAVVALASSGLHTNGYSLARRIVFERMGLGVDDPFPGEDASVADVLLRVHRSYFNPIRELLRGGRIRALAHITGGGLPGNVPRILPEGAAVRIDRSSWKLPNLFRVLQEAGSVTDDEMFRVFNMGIGMIAIVHPEEADPVRVHLAEAGETAWIAGSVETGDGNLTIA